MRFSLDLDDVCVERGTGERRLHDVLVAILASLAKDAARTLVPVALANKRLRALCGVPSLWESPVFQHTDPPAYFVSACKQHGRHFRRLCISGLAQLSGPDASKGLSYCVNLTHLNISSFFGKQKPGRISGRGPIHVENRPTPRPYVWKRLPRMTNLVHLNASDVAITAGCLSLVLKSCGEKLTKLYLSHTFIVPEESARTGRSGTVVSSSMSLEEGLDPDFDGFSSSDEPDGPAAAAPAGPAGASGANAASASSSSGAARALHATSVLRAFTDGVELPRLRELDLSRTVCDERNLSGLLARLPSLAELFLVKPKQQPPSMVEALSWEDWTELGHWSGKRLAAALQANGISVVRKDFLKLIKRAIFCSNQGTPFVQETYAKALELMPVVRRCAGVDARLSNGSTLFLVAMNTGHFVAAKRLVEEFGASPLARCRPGVFRAQDDPWTPPYPRVGGSEVFDGQEFRYGAPLFSHAPGSTLLHLFANTSFITSAADRALINDLPDLFRDWGAAGIANEPTWDARRLRPLHACIEAASYMTAPLALPLAALLGLGADPSLTDARGWTALHAAASAGRPDDVRAILAARPDIVNAREESGCTALLLAVRRIGSEHPRGYGEMTVQFLDCIRALLEQEEPRADAAAADARGFSPLHAAAGRAPSANRDSGTYGWKPFSAASAVARADVVRLLLARPEVDVNARDEEGRTALYAAAFSNCAETALALLAAPGVDVNAGRRGATPLYGACMLHNVAAIRMLLEAGADPSTRPPGHASPIMCLLKELTTERASAEVDDGYPIPYALARNAAALPASVQTELRRLFESKGALLERVDAHGKSALHHAVAKKGPDPAAALEEEADKAAALALRDPMGLTPLMAACQAANRAAVEAFLPHSDPLAADLDGNTALHLCLKHLSVGHGGAHIVSAIVERCPQAARASNLEGRTPLHLLAAASWYDSKVHGQLAWILAGHSEPTARDLLGRTALHVLGLVSSKQLALRGGLEAPPVLRAVLAHPKAAEALAIADTQGNTPLHFAARAGNAQVVAAMLLAGAPAASARDREGRTAAEVAPPATRALIQRARHQPAPPRAPPASLSGARRVPRDGKIEGAASAGALAQPAASGEAAAAAAGGPSKGRAGGGRRRRQAEAAEAASEESAAEEEEASTPAKRAKGKAPAVRPAAAFLRRNEGGSSR
eukprot:tig00020943_g16339.t1